MFDRIELPVDYEECPARPEWTLNEDGTAPTGAFVVTYPGFIAWDDPEIDRINPRIASGETTGIPRQLGRYMDAFGADHVAIQFHIDQRLTYPTFDEEPCLGETLVLPAVGNLSTITFALNDETACALREGELLEAFSNRTEAEGVTAVQDLCSSEPARTMPVAEWQAVLDERDPRLAEAE